MSYAHTGSSFLRQSHLAIPLALGLLVASGCSDYTLHDYKGGYGDPDDTPFVETVGYNEYLDEDDQCTLFNDDFRVGLNGNGADSSAAEIITKITVQGDEEDPYPYTMRVGRQPASGPTSAWTDDLPSDGGGYGSWTAVADSLGELNDINDVLPDESWAPVLEIADPYASDEVCFDYAFVDIAFETAIVNSMRAPPDDSTCSAGSGTFALYPVKMLDADADDDLSVVFQAVQTSGTGVLTDAAWIREITATETHGATLRVIKAGNPYHFLTSDLLANYSTVSLPISSQGSNFSAGVISGGAPFVVEEVDDSVDSDFEVEMEWECGSVSQWKHPPLGYEISSDILDNCTFDFPQKFVIRPRMIMGEPVRLSFLPYGELGNRISVEVEEISNEFQWAYTFLDFHIAGTVDDVDSEEMVVTIDDISWDDVDLCDAGTYHLPVSE